MWDFVTESESFRSRDGACEYVRIIQDAGCDTADNTRTFYPELNEPQDMLHLYFFEQNQELSQACFDILAILDEGARDEAKESTSRRRERE